MVRPKIWVLGAIAILVLLGAGTVFAGGPGGAGAGGDRSGARGQEGGQAIAAHAGGRPSVDAAETPEPTETPEAAETEPAEKPDAAETPEPAEAESAALTDAEAAAFVTKLGAAGIVTTAADFRALAAKVGVGGAVRVLAWAKNTGKSVDQILAMRTAGQGWGQIARQLGESPGIGSIMSGGHGGGHGNGHDKPAKAAESPKS